MIEGMVSTIIPVHNRPGLLAEAVDSVLAQTYRPVEIIIVDDASTDETPSRIRDLIAKNPGVVSSVRVSGVGPGLAREAGRLQARGEFIQYLDSDDWLLPSKFEKQVRALRENPECDIAYGITRLVKEHREVIEPVYKWTGKKCDFLFPGLLVDRWWCTETPLWRRRIVEAVGPWSAMRHTEDWEYEARAGALNARLIGIQDIVSDHRAHGGPRLTGKEWLKPVEQVRFMRTLLSSAVKAGVPADSDEMQHFVRWSFSLARSAAMAGDDDSASQLFELAVAASSKSDRQLRGFRWLANIAGWRRASMISEQVRGLFEKSPGSRTMKQSWMKS